MSDISQINLDGIDYNIKDSNARSNITSLNTDINTLNNNITNIDTKITNVSIELSNEINAVDSKITTTSNELNSKITTTSDEVKGLDTKVTNFNITVTNVSNEVKELDNKITTTSSQVEDLNDEINTVNNRVTTVSDEFNKKLTNFALVEEYGAIGDGATDDTQAIKEAVADCKLTKRKLIFSNKKYLISDTIDMRYVDIDIQGQIIIGHSGIGLIVGDSSITSAPRIININHVTHTNYTEGDISVRIVGLSNGDVTIRRATSVQLYADSNDDTMEHIAYSTFNIGTCEYLQITDNPNVDNPDENPGWINENTFFNCRVMNRFSIEGNTYAHESNVFYKPCFELCDVYLSNCALNKFYDVRSESAKDNKFTLTLDENTSFNYISLGLYYHFPCLIDSQFDIIDNGYNNTITCNELDSLEVIPFLDVNPNTVKKELYEIYKDVSVNSENENLLTLSGGKYGKILSNAIIPVDKIKYIIGKADNSFEWYITPLDENQEIMFNDPLTVYGLTGQNGTSDGEPNGIYLYGLSKFVAISIVNPNVKYLKITIDKGAATTEDITFHNLTLTAYYDSRNELNAIELSNTLKSSISNRLNINTTNIQTVQGSIIFNDNIKANQVYSGDNQVLTEVNANVKYTTGTLASFEKSITDGVETLTLNLPNSSTGEGSGNETDLTEINTKIENLEKSLDNKLDLTDGGIVTGDVDFQGQITANNTPIITNVSPTNRVTFNAANESNASLTATNSNGVLSFLLNLPSLSSGASSSTSKVTYLAEYTSVDTIPINPNMITLPNDESFSNYDLLIIQADWGIKNIVNSAGETTAKNAYVPFFTIVTSEKFSNDRSVMLNTLYISYLNSVFNSCSFNTGITKLVYIDDKTYQVSSMLTDYVPTSLSIIGVKL